jgi:hypothetical protein
VKKFYKKILQKELYDIIQGQLGFFCILCFFKQQRCLAAVFFIFFSLWPVSPATAAPASPDPVEVVQPDGTRIQIRLRGDEYFSWQETEEGYAVVKDTADNFWKYAQPATNRAAFAALPEARVGVADPVKLGLRKHAMPPAELLRAHIEKRRRETMSEPEELPVPGAATNSKL